MGEIKIYQIHTNWYAARNVRDAVRECCSETGESIRDCLQNIRMLDDHELDELDFTYDPYSGDGRMCTFGARLAELVATDERFPTAFACEDF